MSQYRKPLYLSFVDVDDDEHSQFSENVTVTDISQPIEVSAVSLRK